MRAFCLAVLAATLPLSAAVAAAPAVNVPEQAEARDLAAAIAKTTGGLAVKTVFADPAARTVHVHRKTSGEAERHANINDVMIAHKGSVILLIGGRIEGGHEIEPGEWRGGEIIGGYTKAFKSGDMMWIPAGVPHQMILKKGRSFTYSVVKTLG